MKEKYPIDLGKPMNGIAVPVSPTPSKKAKKEKYYPSLYLDWDQDYELPEEGILEIRFKKRSETNRSADGKTTQSVELEMREILDVESESSEGDEESGADALDRYRESK